MCFSIPGSYTSGMKTAISIPDDLFEDAERLARALNKSRSRLYGDAVREYVARHSADHVTGALDEVLEGVTAERGRLRRPRWPERLSSGVCLVISQGEVWWADLVDPASSEPGFRRPVVIVQGDSFNRSRLATVVCVALAERSAMGGGAPGTYCSPQGRPGCPRVLSPTCPR